MSIGDVYFKDKLEEVTHIDMNKIQGGTIPRILHLVWVGEPQELKPYLVENLARWKELMPHWTIKLWTDDDLEVFPAEVRRKLYETNLCAQKSDILRMFILKKYGGVYVDTDIRPHACLDPIIALDYDIVLYHEQPITWEYITQFFIAATPNHPAIINACNMALEAIVNTLDVHIQTGPNLWGRAVGNAIMTPKKYAVLPFDAFLGRELFGKHTYTHSWADLSNRATIDKCNVYAFDNKSRLGADSDGGYVIANLKDGYDCYISAGVSDEESFTRDFLAINLLDKSVCFAFDGTIQDYPWSYTRGITFIKKNISNIESDVTTNLSSTISPYNDIFLKMDIEGSEYNWLDSLSIAELNKFKQIVIEFHKINNDDWNIQYATKMRVLEKLNETHYIVHAHGNNFDNCTHRIPNTIEFTYIRKDMLELPVLNKTPLPIHGLDFPNNTSIPDINLSFPPFTN
jgi:hypothetical protein